MSIATDLVRIQNAKASIKTAIRGKGITVPDETKLDGMAPLIQSIKQGITPTGTKAITENGTYDVTNFASAEVHVPGNPCSRLFTGEIVSTVVGESAYAVLVKDQVIADHFNDQSLRIEVRFDLQPTAYSFVSCVGFNKKETDFTASQYLYRTGQSQLRYDASSKYSINNGSLAALNGVGGGVVSVGYMLITEDGELRCYSKSNNYAIRPSHYTVEVSWDEATA